MADSADPAITDGDLIAYLDGELPDEESTEIERQLMVSEKLRSRVELLKKSFDLLDFLPQAEPSPSFTHQTISRLEALPLPVTGSSTVLLQPGRKSSREIWVWSLIIGLMMVIGFLSHRQFFPLLENRVQKTERLEDVRVVEMLPYYYAVDHFDYLQALHDPELFAYDSNRTLRPAMTVTSLNDQVSADERDQLIRWFKALPVARQNALRELDQKLHAVAPATRSSLFQTLENYSLWLQQLAEKDRQRVLAAENATVRLEVVRQIREREWREHLPNHLQKKLARIASVDEQLDEYSILHNHELTRVREWILAQRHWEAMTGPDKKPWPFNQPDLVTRIDDFLQKSLKVDFSAPPPRGKPDTLIDGECRLSRGEFVELLRRREAAQRNGMWFAYGEYLTRLAELHPVLPPPRSAKYAVVELEQLRKILPKNVKESELRFNRLKLFNGRYPDFPLEATKFFRNQSRVKLGPSAPNEFSPTVQNFIETTLLPKLGKAEKQRLQDCQGRWPDYAKTLMKYARELELTVPETHPLPGPPRQWEELYLLSKPGKS